MPKRSWTEFAGFMVSHWRASWSRLWLLEARLKGASIAGGINFVGRPLISVAKGSRFQIGNNVTINSSLRANPLGCFQPSVLRTLCQDAELVLDSNVGISGCVLCAAKSIRINEGVNIGSGALLMDTDFHQPVGQWEWGSDPGRGAKPIHIGRGAFIGARAIVLKGVTIGERAVVGAGAVVTKDVPSGHIAVGNPARILLPRAEGDRQPCDP